jgi:tRNA(fMet)-specific endonuclease VapC
MEKTELVLCDTDILIEFLDRGNDAIQKNLLAIGFQNIAVSAVSASEMLVGARDKKHLVTINQFIENLIVFPLTSEVSTIHLNLIKTYTLSHKLQIQDALIASTSLVFDIPLYTLNAKDFKFIKGLRLI